MNSPLRKMPGGIALWFVFILLQTIGVILFLLIHRPTGFEKTLLLIGIGPALSGILPPAILVPLGCMIILGTYLQRKEAYPIGIAYLLLTSLSRILQTFTLTGPSYVIGLSGELLLLLGFAWILYTNRSYYYNKMLSLQSKKEKKPITYAKRTITIKDSLAKKETIVFFSILCIFLLIEAISSAVSLMRWFLRGGLLIPAELSLIPFLYALFFFLYLCLNKAPSKILFPVLLALLTLPVWYISQIIMNLLIPRTVPYTFWIVERGVSWGIYLIIKILNLGIALKIILLFRKE